MNLRQDPDRNRGSVRMGEAQIAVAFGKGTILIQRGTLLPDALLLESEPFTHGWRVVKSLDGYGLNRKISSVRWIFFYLAGEIQVTIFGAYGPAKVRRAAKRILSKRKLEPFNALEITDVVRKRFLGIPCTTVIAHSRHIQESWFLKKGRSFENLTAEVKSHAYLLGKDRGARSHLSTGRAGAE